MPKHRSKTLFELPLEIREQIYRHLSGIVSSPASYVREQTSKPTRASTFTIEPVILGRDGEQTFMTFNSIIDLLWWYEMRPQPSSPFIPYVTDLVTSLKHTNTRYTLPTGVLTKIIQRPLWPVRGRRFPMPHSNGISDAVYRCRLSC